MSPIIARKFVHHFQQQPRRNEEQSLSKRELEILDALSKGYHNKQIAQTLGIELETVRSHLKRIYEKLHVNSRTEAVVKFLKQKGPV